MATQLMKRTAIAAIAGTLAAWYAGASVADEGKIQIKSPTDGATVQAGESLPVEYEVHTSARGDHVHISVGRGRPDVVKQLSGTHMVGPLNPGKHTISIVEVTSGHSPTGVRKSIQVEAK